MNSFAYPYLPAWSVYKKVLQIPGLEAPDLSDHAQRTARLAVRLAKAMGISEPDLQLVAWGTLLHDLGKALLPASILNKPGPLSDAEWEIVRMHPVYGLGLLEPVPAMHAVLDILLLHHEYWDGTGYPLGLKGEEIPLIVRICSVVDVWDALTQARDIAKPGMKYKPVLTFIIGQESNSIRP